MGNGNKGGLLNKGGDMVKGEGLGHEVGGMVIRG